MLFTVEPSACTPFCLFSWQVFQGFLNCIFVCGCSLQMEDNKDYRAIKDRIRSLETQLSKVPQQVCCINVICLTYLTNKGCYQAEGAG